MTHAKPVKILGMGKYLPQVISSTELEKKFGLPTGWAHTRSGVLERRRVTDESNGFMGARAAEKALDNAGITLSDVDLLISASATYDYPLPSQASIIKSEITDGNEHHCAAVDISSTCLSFITAFEFAAKLLDGRAVKNILIVTSEISSIGVNPENWETVSLFGDAAVAAVITLDELEQSFFIKGQLKTYSEGVRHTIIEGGGNRHHFSRVTYDKEFHSFKMEGSKLLRLAAKKIPPFLKDFFEDIDLQLKDVDHVIPHQTSKTGMMIGLVEFSSVKERVHLSLEKFGNCIAASIPLTFLLGIESGRIKRGDLCFLTGTAAGFSIGGLLIRY